MNLDKKPQQDSTSPTLEALLKLKRYEQPTEAFWGKFDRELEKRRLQTMVNQDPWPVRLYHGALSQIHPMIALSAASVLVLGLMLFLEGGNESSKEGGLKNTETSSIELAESGIPQAQDLQEAALGLSSYATTTRQPARLSFSDTDFGVDVIAPRPESYQFRQFRTDMEPSTYQVPREDSARYHPDSLVLKPKSLALPVGSSSF